jgi:predicted Zn-dependent protease with MMP-like domain
LIAVDPERFSVLVSEALDSIPDELGHLMENVAVFVDDEAPASRLLGLYQGVPLTQRTGYGIGGAMPDRITIYRNAICAICHDEDDVRQRVRVTVIHEVGHHFGIDDARLHELGWA